MYAQKIMVLTGNADRLLMQPCRFQDSIQIDRSSMNVRYRFSAKNPNTEEGEFACDILMQAGDHYLKQTDLCLHYDHLIWTAQETQDDLSQRRKLAGDRPSNLFSEIICDRNKKEMNIICGDYFQFDAAKSYSQALPQIVWKQSEGEINICGYACKKAEARFGGRNWVAWYSTEIPLSFGPWKLNGLPGLILYATDNQFFNFECVEINQNNLPIMEYKYSSVHDFKNPQKYFRYERSCYEHPYQTFAGGEQAIVMMKNTNGKVVSLDEAWSIPYNPIELE